MDKIQGSNDFRYLSREKKDQFRKNFIGLNDPTGYLFAEEYVEGGYKKWASIQNSIGVKVEVEEWKKTLEIKLQSAAILSIAEQCSTSFQAAKWLSEKGWVEKEDKRTKENKKRMTEVNDHVAADMARLGLKIVS